MLPYLTEHYGNPHSTHRWARCRRGRRRAREQVAGLIGAAAGEIVFTSCASESINLAVKGVAFARGRGHIITSAIEHPATLQACRYLERHFGFALTVLPADGQGLRRPRRGAPGAPPGHDPHHPPAREERDRGDPAGGGGRPRSPGRPACCSTWMRRRRCGKIPVDVRAIGCDLLTVAGHKLYAPKGVGALYVRSGVTYIR